MEGPANDYQYVSENASVWQQLSACGRGVTVRTVRTVRSTRCGVRTFGTDNVCYVPLAPIYSVCPLTLLTHALTIMVLTSINNVIATSAVSG